MTVLTLSIKQKFFDQILSGEKTQEFREIRPKSEDRYCEFSADRQTLIGPKKYDQIKFVTGQFKGTRPFAIVEVAGAEIVVLVDEHDEPIVYTEDGVECVACEVVYTLGQVLS